MSAPPLEFDPAIYCARNPALATLDEAALAQHYEQTGRAKGLCANAIFGRGEFQGLVPTDADVLEIGPYASPSLLPGRHRVKYLDWLTTEQIAAVAHTMPWADPQRLPMIDYVWNGEPYAALVDRAFAAAFSCHAVEHQPDLVHHMCDVASILQPGGRYFLVVPDMRFCFDHFQNSSTIADVLDAHLARRTQHTARNVLAHILLKSHNDAQAHWSGDHGPDPAMAQGERIVWALGEFSQMRGYVDTHAWFFTPANFRMIIEHLAAADLIPFYVERLYPTLRGTFEFSAVLRLK